MDVQDVQDVQLDDLCLPRLFEAQVARTPGAVAVISGDDALTYDALNARANRLAHRLRTLGVGLDVLVGLCVERSAGMVAALLAVLKAGGAYVPLDPAYPPDRLAYMLGDARPAVVVTEARLAALLPAHDARVAARRPACGGACHVRHAPGNGHAPRRGASHPHPAAARHSATRGARSDRVPSARRGRGLER